MVKAKVVGTGEKVRKSSKVVKADKSEKVSAPAATQYYPVVVIGAGFSGINMAIRLKEEGYHEFVVLERADDLGGTWRDNVYPGCACDVPSHVYSYSFEQKPDWSKAYGESDEIRAYLRHCATKHQLLEHMRFGVDVVRAEFNEDAGRWMLYTAAGQVFETRVVVSAIGGLVNPAWPDIPGLKKFKGKVLHTARWDRGYDLTGKRVAVIGTGASAIQLIPEIQPAVKSLTVFQRTPSWVIPKFDYQVTPLMKSLLRKVPLLQQGIRTTTYAVSELVMAPLLILNSPLSRLLENYARAHLEKQVKDLALREKLTPDIRVGCKRLLISNAYYPALQQSNVEVIADNIECITEKGIRTRDGQEHDFDLIVMATGFRLDIGNSPFDVQGLHGKTLSEVWQRPGGKAYKGVSVAGFPNWFIMLGPNTGPGHTSVLIYTEAQADYIMQGIKHLIRKGVKFMSVKNSIQEYYNTRLQGRMKYTSWASGCASWYLDKNGENHTLFPGLASEYVLSISKLKEKEYNVVRWGDTKKESRALVEEA